MQSSTQFLLFSSLTPTRANTSCLSSQHVQKLRKNRDTTTLSGPTDSGAGSAKAATPRKTATPRKRRTPKKEMITDEDDDMNLKLEEAIEDEDMRSPSIRPSKRSKSVTS